MKADELRADACTRFVRLADPVAGRYSQFEAGELVKVIPQGHGKVTVERAKWRNSLTISNVLYGVPEHVVCGTETNGMSQTPPEKTPQA